jgi:hypothetical protein
MAEPRPFQPQLFLFRMLAAIFVAEAGFLAFAFAKCSTPIPGNPVPLVNERCPKLGERSETLFIAAITTTLSLLTGAGAALSQQKSSKTSYSSSPLPQVQETVQERVRGSLQGDRPGTVDRPYTKKG